MLREVLVSLSGESIGIWFSRAKIRPGLIERINVSRTTFQSGHLNTGKINLEEKLRLQVM